jgi:hypothetical protein
MLSRLTAAAIGVLVLLLAACGGYEADIEAVKRSDQPTGIVNEKFATEIAGARGEVTWSASRPETYKDNEHIVLVTATIDRIGKSGRKRQVVLDYIRNRQTDKVDLERVLVDGEPQDIVGAALQLFLMRLD